MVELGMILESINSGTPGNFIIFPLGGHEYVYCQLIRYCDNPVSPQDEYDEDLYAIIAAQKIDDNKFPQYSSDFPFAIDDFMTVGSDFTEYVEHVHENVDEFVAKIEEMTRFACDEISLHDLDDCSYYGSYDCPKICSYGNPCPMTAETLGDYVAKLYRL